MITVTKEQLRSLESLIDVEYDQDVRTDYAGRGMYGSSCLGYTGTNVHEFVTALAYKVIQTESFQDGGEPSALDVLEVVGDIGDSAVDNMGLGLIHYWPEVKVES